MKILLKFYGDDTKVQTEVLDTVNVKLDEKEMLKR
jgi:hypothetical protein